MPFFYILFSKSLNRFYIGSTDGLVEDRLKKHLTNHAGFTAHAKDWEIVFQEEFSTSKEARNRELQIKGWKSRTLIVKLIKSKA